MKKHKLKIEHEYLESLLQGTKKSEIRFNDRDYQKDDVLELWPIGGTKPTSFVVTHIHSGLGMKEGYIVLSLTPLK